MGKRNARGRPERPFSPSLFISTVAVSLSGFLVTLALISPKTWRVQLSAGLLAIVGTFCAMHFVNAFAEYFFHRYVLHATLIPFLSYFYKQHTLHHALTRVVRRKDASAGMREAFLVENNYPIVEEVQHKASFFPWYTFSAFGILWTPLLMLTQRLLPAAPIFLAGFASIAWSLFLYETLHAIEHLPLEKWLPLLEHPRWTVMWRMCYAFHLRHHADIHSNEAVSGFFGIPIADIVFGTLVKPIGLYEDGEVVEAAEFKSPTPRRFIRWLDGVVETRRKNRRKGRQTS